MSVKRERPTLHIHQSSRRRSDLKVRSLEAQRVFFLAVGDFHFHVIDPLEEICPLRLTHQTSLRTVGILSTTFALRFPAIDVAS